MSELGSLQVTIADILRKHRVPGASVGVYRDGTIDVWPFGTTLITSRQPVVPNTINRLASVTKPMVATAIMTLAADRRIDIDRPLADWFGLERRPNWFQTVTLRHLLSHTGGIDCEVPFNLRTLGNGPTALERAVDAFDQVEQWAEPGITMSYANTGYWLLGRILELETGTAFEVALKSLVFEPLGMTSPSFGSDQAILQPIAVGHHDSGSGPVPIRTFSYPRARRPSGGVIGSAEDVLRFAAWHLRPENMIAAGMRQPMTVLRSIDRESWGLGWTIRTSTNNLAIAGHGGSFDGYKAQLTIVPDREFALVALTNSDRGNGAIREIEQLLLRELAGVKLPGFAPAGGIDLETCIGTFEQPHATIRIQRSETGLIATTVARTLGLKEQAEETSRFVPLDESTFIGVSGPQKGARIDFLVDPRTGRRDWLRSGLRIARRMH